MVIPPFVYFEPFRATCPPSCFMGKKKQIESSWGAVLWNALPDAGITSSLGFGVASTTAPVTSPRVRDNENIKSAKTPRKKFPEGWIHELLVPEQPGSSSGSKLAAKMSHVDKISVREEGVTHVPATIAWHPQLRVLDLSGNLIRRWGLRLTNEAHVDP